jgi:hypothetical protein
MLLYTGTLAYITLFSMMMLSGIGERFGLPKSVKRVWDDLTCMVAVIWLVAGLAGLHEFTAGPAGGPEAAPVLKDVGLPQAVSRND